MKNQLTFTCLFLFCFSTSVFSQSDFAAVGTKWTFTEWNYSPPIPVPGLDWINRPYLMESVGEELFEGKLCRKVTTIEGIVDHTFYMYNQNDSVFFWNDYVNRFDLLYDFSAVAGNSWEIGMPFGQLPDGDSTLTVLVDSIGYTVIADDTLKVWYITYNDYADWGNAIIEGIGSSCFLTPEWVLHESHICNLRCFENATADYIFVDYPCDFVEHISAVEERPGIFPVNLYPNPVADYVTLEYTDLQGTTLAYEIFDIAGKSILSGAFPNNGAYRLDTSRLNSGMYELRLSHRGQTLGNAKLVVAH
jgi:hypothetical protein